MLCIFCRLSADNIFAEAMHLIKAAAERKYGMIKKKINETPKRDGLFDMNNAVSATDFTGLIPAAPQNDYTIDSYGNIMDYISSAVVLENAAEEAKKDIGNKEN